MNRFKFPFKSEIDLEQATIPVLHEYFDFWSFQIPNYSYVIDFGGIKNGLMIGIEYKLFNWKSAISQASHHRLVFDFLYILMPFGNYSIYLKGEAMKYGVGILFYLNNLIYLYQKPKRQFHQWIPKKKIVRGYIENFEHHSRIAE